jgi:hypothetical protein
MSISKSQFVQFKSQQQQSIKHLKTIQIILFIHTLISLKSLIYFNIMRNYSKHPKHIFQHTVNSNL